MTAARVGCGLPVRRSSILKERNGRALSARCSQGHDLEGPVATVNDVQQGLCVSGVRIADNGSLLWLRQGIAERLKPLAEAQRLLGHHGFRLSQCLMCNIDIMQGIGEACQLQQDSSSHGVA